MRTNEKRRAARHCDERLSVCLCRLDLAQGLELAVERVSVAHEHIPPPLGRFDAGGAEHVQKLDTGVGGSCSKSSRMASSTALLVLIMSLQISFFSSRL